MSIFLSFFIGNHDGSFFEKHFLHCRYWWPSGDYGSPPNYAARWRRAPGHWLDPKNDLSCIWEWRGKSIISVFFSEFCHQIAPRFSFDFSRQSKCQVVIWRSFAVKLKRVTQKTNNRFACIFSSNCKLVVVVWQVLISNWKRELDWKRKLIYVPFLSSNCELSIVIWRVFMSNCTLGSLFQNRKSIYAPFLSSNCLF